MDFKIGLRSERAQSLPPEPQNHLKLLPYADNEKNTAVGSKPAPLELKTSLSTSPENKKPTQVLDLFTKQRSNSKSQRKLKNEQSKLEFAEELLNSLADKKGNKPPEPAKPKPKPKGPIILGLSRSRDRIYMEPKSDAKKGNSESK